MPVKIPKIITILVVVLTLCMFFFGFFHFVMNQHIKDQTMSCPFMQGHTSVCDVSPLEHVKAWQSAFTTIPTKDPISSLFAIFALFALFGVSLFRKYFLCYQRTVEIILSFRRRNFFIYHYLQEAFSRGILHPKIF